MNFNKDPYQFDPQAKTFLAQVKLRCKLTTYLSGESCLRIFLKFLDQEETNIPGLKRHHIEKYNAGLAAKKLAPQTRYSRLLWARAYLRWLAEREELQTYPDSLIRNFDFPKVPTTLPRPLSPHIDREVQKRFKNSPSRMNWGLLLMRKTGLRIGELADLDFYCIRKDSKNRLFLKVPLGKLNNERLVPINKNISKIVDKIQQDTLARARHRKYGKPTKLFNSKCKDTLTKTSLNSHFHAITKDLKNENGNNVTSHQLRHTYATEMLTAGMSLQGLMKLLGHRCINMTLRYAEVTQQLVMEEYTVAARNITTTFSPYPTLGKFAVNAASASQSLDNAYRLLRNLPTGEPSRKRATTLLLKRLERLQREVTQLEAEE